MTSETGRKRNEIERLLVHDAQRRLAPKIEFFDEHGPYCAFCGACQPCFDAGLIIDPFCWDDPRVELLEDRDVQKYGRHSWARA